MASDVATDDDVLQKADAFMRRHRVFVAGATTSAVQDEAGEEPTVEDEADIPVLTEVVAGEIASLGAPFADPTAFQAAVAAELDAWLDEQLPVHVMRVMDGITDQMIGQLSEKARGELLPRLQARLEALPDQGSDEV